MTIEQVACEMQVKWVTMYHQGNDRAGRSERVAGLTDVGPGVPSLDVQEYQVPVLILVSVVHIRL